MSNPFGSRYRIPLKDGLSGPGTQGIGYGPPPTDDITLPTKDEIFKYQLQLPDPYALTQDTLLIAKICETSHYAKSVHKTLVKKGILNANHHCDTTHIDGSMVNSISIISVPKVRELVNLLFFFSEEVQRWKMLEQEKARLETQAASGQSLTKETAATDVTARVAELNLLRLVIPSQRDQEGNVLVGNASEERGQDMQPPQYVP